MINRTRLAALLPSVRLFPVACSTLNGPLIVLLEKHGIVVREDAFDLGAPSDLAIEACPPTKGKN